MNNIFNQPLNRQNPENNQTFYYPEDLKFDAKTQSFYKADFSDNESNISHQQQKNAPNPSIQHPDSPFSNLFNDKNDMLTSFLTGNLFGSNIPKNEFLSQALNFFSTQKTKPKEVEKQIKTIKCADISEVFEDI